MNRDIKNKYSHFFCCLCVAFLNFAIRYLIEGILVFSSICTVNLYDTFAINLQKKDDFRILHNEISTNLLGFFCQLISSLVSEMAKVCTLDP